MVNPNVKTPNTKRKSLPNVEGEAVSPKKTKLNETTPGKPKIANSPNAAKTPKPTPAKAQGQKKEVKGGNKKNIKAGTSDDSSPKLKKFGGTSGLESADGAKSGQKKRRAQFGVISERVKSGDKEVVKELQEKIDAIKSRKEISKTAKRKIRLLEKLKRRALGEESPAAVSTSKKRRERKAKQQPEKKGDQKQVKKVKPTQEKKVIAVAKGDDEDEDESEESSDFEVESEITPGQIIKTPGEGVEEEESSDEEEEEESGEEEEGEGEEESAEEEGEGEEESEEEGEGEEESEEESEEEEDASEDKKGKKPPTKQVETPDLKQLKENKIINQTQKRYVVFVGNLSYDATKEEILEHFKKAGEVRDIRIPNDAKTNKPRGFAYVEFNNEVDYQKGLSLHHTFIKGRQINVLYTQGGKKKGQQKKNEVKAKNFKLQAMRKQGQLVGSVKASQKRSARRAKQNTGKTSVNGS